MYNTTVISNQSQSVPAALHNKAMPLQQQPELTALHEHLPIQLKLSVGAVNDPLEHEADDMADKVMRMPETSFIQRKAGCGCSCCDQDDEHVRLKPLASQVTPFIQAKSDGAGVVSDAVSSRITSSMGGGSPMQSDTRSFMESRFGTGFGDVKIHNNDESAQLNRSLNAKAFTVSNNIYFNSGYYQPETNSGKHLLAHELTHVVQQGGEINKAVLQRKSYAPDVQKAFGLGPIYNYPGGYPVLSPLNAVDMLDTLLELDNANLIVLQSLIDNLGGAPAGVGVDRLKAYFLGVKNALRQDLMSAAELSSLAKALPLLPDDQQRAIYSFTAAHRTASQDLYKGTKLPTGTGQGNIEKVFNPGATFVAPVGPVAPVVINLPKPDPVCADPVKFSNKVRKVLDPQITGGAKTFRTRKAIGPNFPIASANSMADLAQNETEKYFRPYLAEASRSGAAGTYSLGGGVKASGMLKDQSTTKIWQTTAGRLSWLKYWFNHQTANMNNTLNCDTAQIEAALTIMATDAALIPDIDDYINSWPAEATGGINIQPFLDPTQLVCQRWDTFTTIIHEFIHVLAHPNFRNAENKLPNNGLEILKEGLDDVLRKELWEGAGHLKSQLSSPGRDPDRALIEGVKSPLDPSKVCSHSYYDNLPEAEKVAKIVGMNNVKLAYFLGQTEYLGIGTGTTTSAPGTLAGISFYKTADANDQDVVPVIAGETRNNLLLRTRGSEIRDLANKVLAPAAVLPASVRVPGVHRVYVHKDDTLTSIANQNGISPYEIMRANNLNTTAIVVGTRLIIPKH